MKHKIDWKKVSEGLGISEENTKKCFSCRRNTHGTNWNL